MAKQDVIVDLHYDGDWQDHTADVLVRNQIEITHGRADESGQPAPTTLQLTFRGWDFNPRNPASALFGKIGRNTPIRVRYPASSRFVGEVSSWTPRQSLGGEQVPPDRWVEVVAAGVSRRLEQGADPLHDAVHRFALLNGEVCIGYWPLSDVEGSREAVSGIGGVPLRPTSVLPQGGFSLPVFGGARMASWLPAAMQTAGIGTLRAPVRGTPGGWVVDLAYRAPNPATWQDEFPQQLNVVVDDAVARWLVVLDPSDELVELDILDIETGAVLGSGSAPLPAGLLDGQPHHVRVRAFEQAGDDAALFVDIDGVNVDSIVADLGVAAIPGPGSVAVEWTIPTTGYVLPITVSQVAMFGETVPGLVDSVDAYAGHAGEHAGRRIERLCDEESIPQVFDGDADDTLPVGPQYPDGLLTLLREAADTDHGILVDDRVVLNRALLYRTGRSLYSQDVLSSGLDYDQQQVAPPLDPVTDDQQTRNDVTVSRRDGGSVRATLEAGPMSVQAPPDGVGRVQESVTFNPMGDGQVGDLAGWRLHLGTSAETRFPQITIDTDATPEKTNLAHLLRPGERLRIINLPPELSPDPVDLLVQGYTETIGSHRRKLTFNCTPEEPYHIAEVEHADYSIIGSDSATLAEALDTTETGVDINAGAGPDWVHEGVDFDILIGGERMTVTAVAAMAGTFPNRTTTLTVTRSVNGVVKAHATGTPVVFFHKSYIGL